MRIACPTCAAEYEVPASRLTPGKTVRCVRCGGQWSAFEEVHEQPLVFDADAQAEYERDHRGEFTERLPPMTAMDRLAAAGPPPPRPPRLTGAWILTFAVLIIAVLATIIWRDPLVRAWPPSSRILGSADHASPVASKVPGDPTDGSRAAKE